MKKTFVGIGTGPIQTGIFVSGAAQGGYERNAPVDVISQQLKALWSNAPTVGADLLVRSITGAI